MPVKRSGAGPFLLHLGSGAKNLAGDQGFKAQGERIEVLRRVWRCPLGLRKFVAGVGHRRVARSVRQQRRAAYPHPRRPAPFAPAAGESGIAKFEKLPDHGNRNLRVVIERPRRRYTLLRQNFCMHAKPQYCKAASDPPAKERVRAGREGQGGWSRLKY